MTEKGAPTVCGSWENWIPGKIPRKFDNFLRKIDNGMFGKNPELCTG